jgi:AAA family ATPase
MPLEVDVDFDKLAKSTKGMSGRDIKDKILKVALHKAIYEDLDVVTEEHIRYALKQHKTKQNEPKGMFA